MKVKELIEVLMAVDQELPVAVCANNTEYFSGFEDGTHGKLKISMCHHYAGECVIIGNQYKKT